MKCSRIGAITLVLGALGALTLAAPASAADFTVNDLDDVADAGIDGVCDATGADGCTLRAALDEANATAVGSDTVNITVSGTVTLVNGRLDVDTPTTVNGHASVTTVDANDASGVLGVGGSSVTLNDLRLEDGATLDTDGAGIFSQATLLTLNRVTVTGNQVDSASGGSGGPESRR